MKTPPEWLPTISTGPSVGEVLEAGHLGIEPAQGHVEGRHHGLDEAGIPLGPRAMPHAALSATRAPIWPMRVEAAAGGSGAMPQ